MNKKFQKAKSLEEKEKEKQEVLCIFISTFAWILIVSSVISISFHIDHFMKVIIAPRLFIIGKLLEIVN